LETTIEKNHRNSRVVGRPRNDHGTRISTRITCSACGTVDFVAVRSKGKESIYCRSCAQNYLDAFEVGIARPGKKNCYTCEQCKGTFEGQIDVRRKQDSGESVLCPDCFRGFEVWRGPLGSTPETRKAMSLERRRSGVMLRRGLPNQLT
jgi:hypothetical protein